MSSRRKKTVKTGQVPPNTDTKLVDSSIDRGIDLAKRMMTNNLLSSYENAVSPSAAVLLNALNHHLTLVYSPVIKGKVSRKYFINIQDAVSESSDGKVANVFAIITNEETPTGVRCRVLVPEFREIECQ